jgi:hypothetical protein
LSKISCALLFIFGWVASAFCQTTAEQQKIEYLIQSIATLQNATFIRNGVAYDAPHAAEHLRLKLRLAGNRVKTAQDFIVTCATASSVSAQKYQIKFQDGRVVEAATYLRNKLKDYATATRQPLSGTQRLPGGVLRSPSLPAADDRIRA